MGQFEGETCLLGQIYILQHLWRFQKLQQSIGFCLLHDDTSSGHWDFNKDNQVGPMTAGSMLLSQSAGCDRGIGSHLGATASGKVQHVHQAVDILQLPLVQLLRHFGSLFLHLSLFVDVIEEKDLYWWY